MPLVKAKMAKMAKMKRVQQLSVALRCLADGRHNWACLRQKRSTLQFLCESVKHGWSFACSEKLLDGFKGSERCYGSSSVYFAVT